jgi:hypothetical protein
VRRTTRDHATIQAWAEERGASPARVRGAGVLRLAFSELPPTWERLDWPTFFAEFDRGQLAFFYEDAPGSRICKLVKGRLLDA